MNPLTNMKNVKKLSEQELKGRNKTSWHDQYRGSAWIFIGGLPFDLTEGDIICVFSQYGEPININLVRDKDSGKSKGFCFICYEDQRSTDLAVDNLNGIKLLGRILRVDHVNDYKPPKERKDDDDITKVLKREGLPGVAAIKKEEPVRVKQERSPKRVVKQENMDSESEDDRAKMKEKKKKKKTHKKNRQESSSESSSDSESGSSSDSEEEARKRKKKKMKKGRVQSLQSGDGSSIEDPQRKNKKRRTSETEKNNKGKNAKSIEELQKEALLIQEELQRRQLAKELEEVQRMIDESEKKKKMDSSSDHRRKHHSSSSREHGAHNTSRSREGRDREDRHERRPGDRRKSRTPERLASTARAENSAKEVRKERRSRSPKRSRSPRGRDHSRGANRVRHRPTSSDHHRRRRSPS